MKPQSVLDDMTSISEKINSSDVDTVYGGIVDARKEKAAGLVHEIARFLEHQESDLRRQAVLTVSALDENNEYEGEVKVKWVDQAEDELVRSVALDRWVASYYADSGWSESELSDQLYGMIHDSDQPPALRKEAYHHFLNLHGYFDDKTTWERMQKIDVLTHFERDADFDLVDKLRRSSGVSS